MQVKNSMCKKKIFAVSGSTRKDSTNMNLINAIADLFSDELDIIIFQGISTIPHFNPDLDIGNSPEAVEIFRRKIHEADGILICTPQYAMGVPGTLKNAIDWTVSSMEFSHKPVALITASLAGHKGHLSLMETLKVIEADIPDSSRLLISFAKTKIGDNKIINVETLAQVIKLIDSLMLTIGNKTKRRFKANKETNEISSR